MVRGFGSGVGETTPGEVKSQSTVTVVEMWALFDSSDLLSSAVARRSSPKTKRSRDVSIAKIGRRLDERV